MKKPLLATVILAAGLLVSSCASPGDQPDGASNADPSASSGPVVIESLPFNASGLLGGPAQPNLPDSDPGEVAVVQVGPLDTDSGTLIFAFRNNTGDGISHVDWSATARSAGSIVATGSSQGTIPAQVQPGEIGLAYIYFDNSAAIPEGTHGERQPNGYQLL